MFTSHSWKAQYGLDGPPPSHSCFLLVVLASKITRVGDERDGAGSMAFKCLYLEVTHDICQACGPNSTARKGWEMQRSTWKLVSNSDLCTRVYVGPESINKFQYLLDKLF